MGGSKKAHLDSDAVDVDVAKPSNSPKRTVSWAPQIESTEIAVEETGATAFEKALNVMKGLTTAEAEEKLAKFGYNEVVEYTEPEWKKIAGRYLGLVPLVLLVTSILSVTIKTKCPTPDDVGGVFEDKYGCTEDRDWVSFGLLLFEMNLIIWVDYLGERNSNNAIASLKSLSAPSCRVRRDNEWRDLPIRELVVGDIVSLAGGTVCPCDGRLLGSEDEEEEVEPIVIDESSLTGETLPVTRGPGDEVRSGGVILQGELEAMVTATGEDTFFGKAMVLLNSVQEQGHVQMLLSLVAKMLAGGALVFLIGLFFVQLIRDDVQADQAIKLCFVILVAVLPVAMPVVVTTGLAVGALELSKEKAIVQRLSAIEEMAGMDILCSDKTGTLTKNVLELDPAEIEVLEESTGAEDLLLVACLAARFENQDAIDKAVTNALVDTTRLAKYKVKRFVPFNPVDKKTMAYVEMKDYISKVEGETGGFIASKGAPSVMHELPGVSAEARARAKEIIVEKAERGLRVVGVASSFDDGKSWTLLGYISLLDPPRHDTAHTIAEAQAQGIDVKMITGDQRAIAIETARRLELGTNILGSDIWSETNALIAKAGGLGKLAEECNGFASVFPEHKFKIVESLQNEGHICGMTGDGVNDAPALKRANVGIAVAGATDAAKSAADIVLTAPGLSTIVTALNRSRKIFKRLQAYVIYRLASSFLILGFFFLSIVALKFQFPTWVLIIVSIVNDFTIMATTKDTVRSSKEPLKWDMKRVLAIAVTIGGLCIVQCFLLLYLSLAEYGDWWDRTWGMGRSLSHTEVVAVIYLDLTIAIQLNIFSARTKSWHFVTSESADAAPAPSAILALPVFGSLILSTFLAVYWPDDAKLGGGASMKGCGWEAALVTWGWGIVWFIVVDGFKVIMYQLIEDDGMGSLFYTSVLSQLMRGTGRESESREVRRTAKEYKKAMQIELFDRSGGVRARAGSQEDHSELLMGRDRLHTLETQVQALQTTQAALLEGVMALLKANKIDVNTLDKLKKLK